MNDLIVTITALIDQVPGVVWAGLLGGLLVVTILVLPLARRHARKAGARAAGHSATPATDRRDRALFIAALVPGCLFLTAVLAGSQRGLIAFGRDDLRWHDGWEYLVPATLDGVGIAFAFLAFRAVRRRRSPDRAVRVAWGAAIASAVINFGHEAGLIGGSALGGGYLALLSLFVMVMFHELLDQFTEGTEWVVRDRPAFGLRWLTWPTNTVCAWVAWRNWPPVEGTKATVAAAVSHLDGVRVLKREIRLTRAAVSPGAPWWTPIMPWLRVWDLDAVLADQRSTREAERVAWAEQVAALEAERANGAARLATVQAETEHHRSAAMQAAEQAATERAERLAVQERLAATEQARQAAETLLLRLRSGSGEPGDQPEPAVRSSTARSEPTRSAGAPNAPKFTDEEALTEMLRRHKDPGFEWTKREVHRITGAGFGRVDKLLIAIAEHHRNVAERNGGAPAPSGMERPDDDASERVS